MASGIEPVASSTVYRFIHGHTHARGATERRGRRAVLSKKDVSKLDKACKRLLKRSDSYRPVTYEAIQEEAGLQGKCCSRTAQDALRGIGVRFRAPRHKVYLTAEDAKKRLQVAKEWIKRPAAFWKTAVHAYADNKAFPLPLTPRKRRSCRRRR